MQVRSLNNVIATNDLDTLLTYFTSVLKDTPKQAEEAMRSYLYILAYIAKPINHELNLHDHYENISTVCGRSAELQSYLFHAILKADNLNAFNKFYEFWPLSPIYNLTFDGDESLRDETTARANRQLGVFKVCLGLAAKVNAINISQFCKDQIFKPANDLLYNALVICQKLKLSDANESEKKLADTVFKDAIDVIEATASTIAHILYESGCVVDSPLFGSQAASSLLFTPVVAGVVGVAKSPELTHGLNKSR